MTDFRLAKEAVNKGIKELREKDPNWGWRAVVTKKEIKVYWSYLQYCDRPDSHFTIKMSDRPEESPNNDDFMVARNERDEYLTGAIVGEECWKDGSFEKCVERLLIGIGRIARSRY